jgi:hypothetical protein
MITAATVFAFQVVRAAPDRRPQIFEESPHVTIAERIVPLRIDETGGAFGQTRAQLFRQFPG